MAKILITELISALTMFLGKDSSDHQSCSEEDKQGVFLHTLAGELCSYLMQPEILNKPCSELTRAIASEAVWVAQRLLTDTSVVEPTKVLNTFT